MCIESLKIFILISKVSIMRSFIPLFMEKLSDGKEVEGVENKEED